MVQPPYRLSEEAVDEFLRDELGPVPKISLSEPLPPRIGTLLHWIEAVYRRLRPHS